ncbi:hypothetical protein [Streptomyces sp. NPDC088400]|uniref:hypothetical protein n=1 Tax=Streptomyces sp. NPDC088400 TaxID=3365861 RepID=UPI003800913F
MIKTAAGKTRNNKYRLAAEALGGLGQDLFRHAFANRPLKPLRTDAPIIRRLPVPLRAIAAWTPHAAIVAGALSVLIVAVQTHSYLPDFLPVLAVLLTMFRPVGAWWLALAGSVVITALDDHNWPWTPSAFLGYLIVMAVVTIRTSPRVAAGMWVITAAYATYVETFLTIGFGDGNSTSLPMLLISALLLPAVSMVHVRRETPQGVAAAEATG